MKSRRSRCTPFFSFSVNLPTSFFKQAEGIALFLTIPSYSLDASAVCLITVQDSLKLLFFLDGVLQTVSALLRQVLFYFAGLKNFWTSVLILARFLFHLGTSFDDLMVLAEQLSSYALITILLILFSVLCPSCLSLFSWDSFLFYLFLGCSYCRI